MTFTNWVHNQIGATCVAMPRKVGALDTGLQMSLVLAAHFRNGSSNCRWVRFVVPEMK